jgi:two-component system C4-dicarboxylate transport sensor histidine kinase DctB
VEGLQKIASCELRLSSRPAPGSVDLATVLDELRIVVEPSFPEAGVALDVEIPPRLPPVVGEPHGLLQIFLSLASSSFKALQGVSEKRLRVTGAVLGDGVCLRFNDTGPGVDSPERLFRPFQAGEGPAELVEA